MSLKLEDNIMKAENKVIEVEHTVLVVALWDIKLVN